MIAAQHKDATQRGYEASFYPWQLNVANFEGFTDGLCFRSDMNVITQDLSLNYTPLQSFEESKQSLVFHPDHGIRSGHMQQHQLRTAQSQLNPFAANYCFLGQLPQSCQYDHNVQDFEYFIVIDFEATCDKERYPHPQEIIEFPAVIVNATTGQLEACFQTYVRPMYNQLLSDFCKDLTGIQQIQVDRGISLSEALFRHDKWLEEKGIKNNNFAVVTWSNWDCQVMLESECSYKRITKPSYFNRWINLRVPFHEVFGEVKCSLKMAVEKAGLTWQGRAHCGLDDAKNTARLLVLLMHKGIKFSITNSLAIHESFTRKPIEEQPLHASPQCQKSREVQASPLQFSPCCHCGVMSRRGMIRKPGPKKGSLFFGCGNWTAAKGARCLYFEWASP